MEVHLNISVENKKELIEEIEKFGIEVYWDTRINWASNKRLGVGSKLLYGDWRSNCWV